MTINNRIRILIELLAEGKQRRFAEKAGLNAAAVNGIIGKKASDPTFSTLKKIIDAYPDIDLTWLMKGEGRPLTTSGDSCDSIPVSESTSARYAESLSKVKNSHYLTSNLKIIRNHIHATQESFGRMFGVTRDAIASYERGFKPKLPFLNDLISYFNISLDDLTEFDIKEHPEVLEKISAQDQESSKNKK